ncbi:MAG: FlgD immunoglobulin-like domain containing protein [Candidatus Cloacimonadales bacterium]|nr:FlgD immunoglobulin-like domain containing protein [Candidatus Cloacimonadales bacterium]
MLTYEPDVTFAWFVDDELQIEISFIFNVSLTVNGWHEITGVASKNGYDYVKIWWVEITGGTNSENIIITTNKLFQNSPNPFNPSTTISFELYTETSENTELVIYNLKGQLIKTLVSEPLSAGRHSYVWNGTDESGKKVSNGIYFYKLTSGDYSETRKALMLK